MELAKHRVQCIQKHVSYKEHIHQIIYKAYSTKQLSLNARLGVQRAADLGEQAAVSMGPAPTRTLKGVKGNTALIHACHSSLYS